MLQYRVSARMSKHVQSLRTMTTLDIPSHWGHLGMHLLLWARINWPFWLARSCISTSKVAKRARHNHNHNTQHTTHNNQNEPPPWHRLCLLSHLSIGKLLAPPTNGAAAPYDPMQVDCGRVWRRDGWFACLGGGMKAHQKNREIKVYWP